MSCSDLLFRMVPMVLKGRPDIWWNLGPIYVTDLNISKTDLVGGKCLYFFVGLPKGTICMVRTGLNLTVNPFKNIGNKGFFGCTDGNPLLVVHDDISPIVPDIFLHITGIDQVGLVYPKE